MLRFTRNRARKPSLVNRIASLSRVSRETVLGLSISVLLVLKFNLSIPIEIVATDTWKMFLYIFKDLSIACTCF